MTSPTFNSLVGFLSLFILTNLPAQVVIEDFNDGNTRNNLGGYWYTFNDNGDGGKSRLKQKNWQSEGFVPTGGYQSSGMLSLDVLLEKANYQWSPYFSIATSLNKTEPTNPKNFAGISYWHKGAAHAFRVDIPEVKDYDFHQISVPAHDLLTLVTIDFSTLTQEGWGKRVDLNLDNSVNLVWNLNKTSGEFQIDHVQFVKEILYEKQYDMEILPAYIPDPVEVLGNVHTKLNKLSQKYLTKGMNLTNWGEQSKITSADPSTWRYNEQTIIQQAKQGMLGIRFPIDFDLYIQDRSNVLSGANKHIVIEPMLYTVLDSMNVWTKRHGLSLTIDYHAYDATYNRAASKNEQFKGAMASLWRVIAEHFVSEKRKDLFFELTNEPGLSLAEDEFIDQSDWRSLAQMMVDSIRTVDKKRPLIFGDVKWYSLDELVKNTPLNDRYVIYCFHMYDPFVFTHQGASWTNMGTMKNVPFPYSPQRWSTEFRDFGVSSSVPLWVRTQMKDYYKEGNKQHIKNRLAIVKNWAYTHNVPLICNEWGALPNTSKLEDLNSYFQTMGEIFEEMDISWQVWFGVMDNEMNLLPGMAKALNLEVQE